MIRYNYHMLNFFASFCLVVLLKYKIKFVDNSTMYEEIAKFVSF